MGMEFPMRMGIPEGCHWNANKTQLASENMVMGMTPIRVEKHSQGFFLLL